MKIAIILTSLSFAFLPLTSIYRETSADKDATANATRLTASQNGLQFKHEFELSVDGFGYAELEYDLGGNAYCKGGLCQIAPDGLVVHQSGLWIRGTKTCTRNIETIAVKKNGTLSAKLLTGQTIDLGKIKISYPAVELLREIQPGVWTLPQKIKSKTFGLSRGGEHE